MLRYLITPFSFNNLLFFSLFFHSFITFLFLLSFFFLLFTCFLSLIWYLPNSLSRRYIFFILSSFYVPYFYASVYSYLSWVLVSFFSLFLHSYILYFVISLFLYFLISLLFLLLINLGINKYYYPKRDFICLATLNLPTQSDQSYFLGFYYEPIQLFLLFSFEHSTFKT